MFRKTLIVILVLTASIALSSCGSKKMQNWSEPAVEEELPQDDMNHAKNALAKIMNRKAQTHKTKHIDKAKAAYECWAENKPMGTKNAAECKSEFYSSISELDPFIMDNPVNIYFGEDSYFIRAREAKKIQKLIDKLETLGGDYKIVLNGHTDTASSEDHNMKLAKLRAESVKELMSELYVPEEKIQLFAFGEMNPPVKTKDEVSEPRNRRVEIFVSSGSFEK